MSLTTMEPLDSFLSQIQCMLASDWSLREQSDHCMLSHRSTVEAAVANNICCAALPFGQNIDKNKLQNFSTEILHQSL